MTFRFLSFRIELRPRINLPNSFSFRVFGLIWNHHTIKCICRQIYADELWPGIWHIINQFNILSPASSPISSHSFTWAAKVHPAIVNIFFISIQTSDFREQTKKGQTIYVRIMHCGSWIVTIKWYFFFVFTHFLFTSRATEMRVNASLVVRLL